MIADTANDVINWLTSDAIDWLDWDWDWANFWPELIAGVATFALGLLVAWYFFIRGLQEDRQKETEGFRNIARAVRSDLLDARNSLLKLKVQVDAGAEVDRVDAIPLLWELAKPELVYAFASRGLQREIHVAFTWYKRSVEAVKKYKDEKEAGNLKDATQSSAIYRITGGLAQIDHAITRVTLTAKLPPSAVPSYPDLTPRA